MFQQHRLPSSAPMISDRDFDAMFVASSALDMQDSLLPGIGSRHARSVELPASSISLEGLALPGEPKVLVLRRFDQGDWFAPHRAMDEIGATGVDWVAIVAVHADDRDGVTYWTPQGFQFHSDDPGSPLVVPAATWCWRRPTSGSAIRVVSVGGSDA